MRNPKLFKLKVRDAHKVIFEGEVDRLSSFNDVGPFDVFPMHANFISIIQKSLSIYKNNQKIQEVPIEKAVLKVKDDLVKVFLGLEVIPLDEKSDSKNTKKISPDTSKK